MKNLIWLRSSLRPAASWRAVGIVLPLLAPLAVVPAQANVSPNPAAPQGSATAPLSPDVKKLVTDAQKAIHSGNFRLAIILLKNALTSAPANGTIRAQLGMVELQSGDPASAERELRQARRDGAPDQLALNALLQVMLANQEEKQLLAEFPDPGPMAQGSTSADILKARAIAQQKLGNLDDAAATMDHSLALRRDVSGLLVRARLAQAQNNPTLAKSLSDEALKIAPDSYDAQLFRLSTFMAANDHAGALALVNQLIQRYPDNLSARLARLEIYLQLKKDSLASADVDAILAKAPGSPIGQYYKALLLARQNKIAAAWRIAQSLPPEFIQSKPSIAAVVSQMAISSGAVETGAAILSTTLAKTPGLVDIRLRLAAIRLRQKSYETALSVMQPLKDSTDPRALAVLSQIYLGLHQYSNALDVLNKLNASGGGGSGTERELALIEMQSGQTDQGIKALQDLADKQPTDLTVVGPLIAALVQAKRLPEALAAADRLGSDPNQRVQADVFRAQILVLQNKVDAALDALNQAVQADPKNLAALFYRAGMLESLKRYPEADKDLDTILRLDPKNATALIKRAEVAARQNQNKAAYGYLNQAIAAAPQNPAPRLALARLQAAQNDTKGAIATTTALVAMAPKNTDALAALGQLQERAGQYDQAIASFQRLAKLMANVPGPRLLLADAYFAKGDRAHAAQALDAAAAVAPHSLQVRAAQVRLMLANGKIQDAIKAAQAFQSANPGTDADLMLADTLTGAKEFSQASAVLQHSLGQKPSAQVLLRLSQIDSQSGNNKHAETILSDWLSNNQQDLAVRIQYAGVLMQEGDNAKAKAQYELILHQAPDNIVALNNLAWLLQKDDPTRAIALSTRAYGLAPASSDVVDTLGMLKLQQKDAKGALTLLKQAHDLRPKDGEITYHLVLALDASGNHESAKGLLKALLDTGVKFNDIVDALKLSVRWQ